MQRTNKEIWYEWESIVVEEYLKNGYKILKTNFTFPGWEIDIIAKKDNILHFVEVKVVNYVDDIHWYISKQKLSFLDRSIQTYLYKNKVDLAHVLDVVFVKNWKIFHKIINATAW